jgi:hypothetical protein
MSLFHSHNDRSTPNLMAIKVVDRLPVIGDCHNIIEELLSRHPSQLKPEQVKELTLKAIEEIERIPDDETIVKLLELLSSELSSK